MTEFYSKSTYKTLAIAVYVLQILSFHCTHEQNDCRTIPLLVKPFGDVLFGVAVAVILETLSTTTGVTTTAYRKQVFCSGHAQKLNI